MDELERFLKQAEENSLTLRWMPHSRAFQATVRRGETWRTWTVSELEFNASVVKYAPTAAETAVLLALRNSRP